jgi:hypothetical protein
MSAPLPGQTHGRIPHAENAAPPLWFGIAFDLAGGGMIVAGFIDLPGTAGGPNVILIAFGLFFGLIGVGLTLTTLRADRARLPLRGTDRPGVDAGWGGGVGPLEAGARTAGAIAVETGATVGAAVVGAEAVERFTRSPMRILVDLVLAPLGGVAFLGLAFLILGYGPMAWIASAMFGFFGILILGGAAVTVRRGAQATVLEIGPGGIRLMDLERRLAWSEIDHLEVEVARGAGASGGLAQYRRLGIWPRDQELAVHAPGRALVGVGAAFAGFTNRLIGTAAGMSDPSKMAPFGIWAYEIEQDFAELLRSVGRYAPIVGAQDEVGVPLEAARGVTVPPAAMPGGITGAIFENLAEVGRAPAPAALDGGSVAAGRPAGIAAPIATRTFVRRPGAGSITSALGPLYWSAFMILVPAGFLGSQLVMGPAVLGNPLVWGFDLVAIAFVGYGIGSFLELPGRWRMVRGGPVLATVDRYGMEMRGMGRLAWTQIAEARVVASSIPTEQGHPAIRRLELVPLDPTRLAQRPWSDRAHDRFLAISKRLIPLGAHRRRSPGAFALDLDLLVDPEGLLEAIARYRIVDES